MPNLETAIRGHLVDYLSGNLPFDDFVDWLVGASWNIERDGTVEARELVYAIELALAEASSGLLTPDELDAQLRNLSQHVNLSFSSGPRGEEPSDVLVHSGSEARTLNWSTFRKLLSQPPLLIGTRSVAASW